MSSSNSLIYLMADLANVIAKNHANHLLTVDLSLGDYSHPSVSQDEYEALLLKYPQFQEALKDILQARSKSDDF